MRFASNKRVPFEFPDDESRRKHQEKLEYEENMLEEQYIQDSPHEEDYETFEVAQEHLRKFKRPNYDVDGYQDGMPARIRMAGDKQIFLNLKSQEELLGDALIKHMHDIEHSELMQKDLLYDLKFELEKAVSKENFRQSAINKILFGSINAPSTNIRSGSSQELSRLQGIKNIATLLKPENRKMAYEHIKEGFDRIPNNYPLSSKNLNRSVEPYIDTLKWTRF